MKDNVEKELGNDTLRESAMKIMKLMIPFTPHLAHECLELLQCKTLNTWPKIEKNIINDIKLVVQVNGKTRDIITIKKDLSEVEINNIILKSSKAAKYIKGNKIMKTIFIKNKIKNYIMSK